MNARAMRNISARLPLPSLSCACSWENPRKRGTIIPAAAVPHKFLISDRLLNFFDMAPRPSYLLSEFPRMQPSKIWPGGIAKVYLTTLFLNTSMLAQRPLAD